MNTSEITFRTQMFDWMDSNDPPIISYSFDVPCNRKDECARGRFLIESFDDFKSFRKENFWRYCTNYTNSNAPLLHFICVKVD